MLGMVSCIGGDDDEGGGGGGGNCDFQLEITDISCEFFDNPDVFAADSWFVHVSGTAKGPSSTQLSIENNVDAVQTTTECESWGAGAGSFSCISAEGQPETTTWTAVVEELIGMSTPASEDVTVTAKVKVVLATHCYDQELTKDATVTCTQ
jgi:hypothetical protein